VNLLKPVATGATPKFSALMLVTVCLLSACNTLPTTPAAGSTTTPAPVGELSSGPAVKTTAGGGYLAGDGPGADAPANIDAIADATPRAEPLHRYANRPYTALGKNYNPLTKTGTFKERGIASWYGKKFHGQRTSIGEIYDMYGMTAAHPTLPIPSYARITNPNNQKSVILRINDRGPFLHDRVIDLSYTAAYKLGLLGNGSGEVEIESLTPGNENVASAALAPAPKITVATLTPVEISLPATASKTGKVFLQLGAFGNQESANSFMAKIRDDLSDANKSLSLDKKNGLTRVQYGPYATADQARKASVELTQKLGFKPFVSVRE
jgi:rare lipoprotein A